MNNDATIISKWAFLSKNDFTYLTMKGAVGDVLTHFIDKTVLLLSLILKTV